jgi:hypothetical protein
MDAPKTFLGPEKAFEELTASDVTEDRPIGIPSRTRHLRGVRSEGSALLLQHVTDGDAIRKERREAASEAIPQRVPQNRTR